MLAMLGWSDWLLTIPLCEEVIMGFSANINLLDNGTVVKVFKDNILKSFPYQRDHEIQALSRLDSVHFPKVIGYMEKDPILSYQGEPLTKKNMPTDWENQMLEILAQLAEKGIRHNDCVPENLLIKDGIISLVDLAMSSDIGQPFPQPFPAEGNNLKTILRDGDEIMLRRAFDWIRGKKVTQLYLDLPMPDEMYRVTPNTEWNDIAAKIADLGKSQFPGSSVIPRFAYHDVPFSIGRNIFPLIVVRMMIDLRQSVSSMTLVGRAGLTL